MLYEEEEDWCELVTFRPVVRRLDTIHRIHCCPVVSVDKTNLAIHWIVIYAVNGVIRLSNNPDLGLHAGLQEELQVAR